MNEFKTYDGSFRFFTVNIVRIFLDHIFTLNSARWLGSPSDIFSLNDCSISRYCRAPNLYRREDLNLSGYMAGPIWHLCYLVKPTTLLTIALSDQLLRYQQLAEPSCAP